MVKVVRASTKKEYKQFENAGEIVLKDDPYFVPPFPGSLVKLLSPKGPLAKHGGVACFVAYRDGKVVGRVAAMENDSYNKYHGEEAGFFGFFDFINDVEVARALLHAARDYFAAKGIKIMRGPYNTSYECGLLVEGFESSPMVMMVYNPPYYVDMYGKLGLIPARNLYAFYISGAQEAPARILKIVERVKRNTGITCRPINMKNLDPDLRAIQEIYNGTLNRNWGFVPMTFEDIKAVAADLVEVADPELIMIAEKDGKAIGFSLVIPNINEFMWRARGSGTFVRILKFVWWLKTSRPKEARLAVLGVLPEYQNKGLGALFYAETLLKGGRKYLGGELSWVEENNKEIIAGITVMGAQKYKSYRIYESATAGATH
ncbi:GNAT family N-acetyltransferase [bacterium]|nr:GNAT family N-acetyltransferase [bacterium]